MRPVTNPLGGAAGAEPFEDRDGLGGGLGLADVRELECVLEGKLEGAPQVGCAAEVAAQREGVGLPINP